MVFNPIYKKYFLHFMFWATLSATAYYRYQDYIGGSNESVVESVNTSFKMHENIINYKNNSPTITEAKGEFNVKVDIFEIYKKEVPASELKRLAKRNAKVKPNFDIATSISPPVSLPTAPTLPFKYIGKLYGDNEYQVFLVFNGKNLVVRNGDTILQTYKVEKISPPLMTLTYIPMNISQNMQIGEPD